MIDLAFYAIVMLALTIALIVVNEMFSRRI